MAQRSAAAQRKLDKITAASSADRQHHSPTHGRHPKPGTFGGARLGSGGLLTPSASSVSGSSRNSLSLNQPQHGVRKGALRAFFEGQSEKLRKLHGHRRESSDGANFYTGLGGGLGSGSRLGSMSTIGEETTSVKRWEGNGNRGEMWDGGGKGKKDLELWFPDGDTLIYLTEKPSAPRTSQGLYKPPTPQPSFRLRSSVLRQTESPFLISLLEESTQERPPTPDALPTSPVSLEGMEYEYQLRRSATMETMNSAPASINTTATQDSIEQGIKYRLYFPAPARLDKPARHRYHLTTRNFFAVLFDKSLVGVTLGQTLLDLVDRTDRYLLSSSPMAYDVADRGISEIESPYGAYLATLGTKPQPEKCHPNTHRIIIDYLLKREFDDARSWTEGAAGLLVYAEKAAPQRDHLNVGDMQRIDALWKEGFVHCTGQLSLLQVQPEWRDISPITKALIDRASLEIQVRVAKADARLAGFQFIDMWPISSAAQPSARIAFDKFQKFLMKHYQSRFGSWPPPEGHLSRILYVHLQRDFDALYDYLVDQDVIWSPPNSQLGPGRRIIKPSVPHWRADDEQLQITDILSRFDERENHPPMPNPFPLIPATTGNLMGNHTSVSATPSPAPPKKGQRFFPTASASSLRARAHSNPAAALALSESTNIGALYSKSSNPLVEAFTAHEKSVPSSEVAPHDARKGRWIMIYGVLQTLATVAPDAPGVKWTEGVEYFLNPKLRGTPPWKAPATPEDSAPDERSHFRSHCWTSRMPAPPTMPPPRRTRERIDQRARSRSRSQKATIRERRLQKLEDPMDVENRNGESGDEGDDEMDGGSPTEAGEGDSPSPPPLRTWGSRGQFQIEKVKSYDLS